MRVDKVILRAALSTLAAIAALLAAMILALWIEEKLPQSKRLERLNQVAIKQMRILTEEQNSKLLGEKK